MVAAINRTVEAWAPAKLNLTLEVLGVRDDGFHSIRSVFQAIELYDYLRFGIVPASSGHWDVEVRCNDPQVPLDGDNLVTRAVQLFATVFAQSQSPARVTVDLHKRIPTGAGLGGGSANAAAALVAMRELLGLSVPDEDMQALAAELGSDVPFFLAGPLALVEGRGERIEPLEHRFPASWFVLVKPPLLASTARVYGEFDRIAGSEPLRGQWRRRSDERPERRERPAVASALKRSPTWGLIRAIADGDIAAQVANLHNALEPAAFSLYPALEDAKKVLERAGAPGVCMSGSGATLYGVCSSVGQALMVTRRVREMPANDTTWIEVVGPSRVAITTRGTGSPSSSALRQGAIWYR